MVVVTTARELQDAVEDEGGPPHVHVTEHLDLSELTAHSPTTAGNAAYLVVASTLQSITVRASACSTCRLP